MKKNIKYASSIILGGLVAFNVSSAEFSEHEHFAWRCKELASALDHLSQSKSQDLCAGDVAIAAAYISATETNLRRHRNREALVTIHYANSELKEIAYSRSYCANLSSLIKPYIAKTIQLSSDIEALESIKINKITQ